MKSAVVALSLVASVATAYSPPRHMHFPRVANGTNLTSYAPTAPFTSLFVTTTDELSDVTVTSTVGSGDHASVITTTLRSTLRKTMTIPRTVSPTPNSNAVEDKATATRTIRISNAGDSGGSGGGSGNGNGNGNGGNPGGNGGNGGADCVPVTVTVTVTAPASTVYVTTTPSIVKPDDGGEEPKPTTPRPSTNGTLPYTMVNGTVSRATPKVLGTARLT